MSSPLSPVIADIVIQNLEELATIGHKITNTTIILLLIY